MTEATYEARDARHFDGRTPESHPATVRLEPGWLSLSPVSGESRRWPLDRVRLMRAEPRLVQLELLGEPVEALIIEDEGFAAALRAANGGKKVAGLGSGGVPAMRILLVLALLAVFLLFAAWRWGIPALAILAADTVPPEWERRFGAEVVAGTAKQQVDDPRVVTPVRERFVRLVRAEASTRDSFQLIVMRDRMVNAFAAPGGYVVVTTGLLDALRDPDELAAVMAHEISHVTRRHTTRGLFKRLGVRALFSLIAGDQAGLGAVVGAAGTLGELSYSRHDETEADEAAVELLAKAGIDPSAMDRALESISGERSGGRAPELGFLSTHPSTAGRRERVRKLAAEAKSRLRPPSAPR